MDQRWLVLCKQSKSAHCACVDLYHYVEQLGVAWGVPAFSIHESGRGESRYSSILSMWSRATVDRIPGNHRVDGTVFGEGFLGVGVVERVFVVWCLVRVAISVLCVNCNYTQIHHNENTYGRHRGGTAVRACRALCNDGILQPSAPMPGDRDVCRHWEHVLVCGVCSREQQGGGQLRMAIHPPLRQSTHSG